MKLRAVQNDRRVTFAEVSSSKFKFTKYALINPLSPLAGGEGWGEGGSKAPHHI
jgi:hypothetical protein